jgi:uncharacterized coiled-coil protein SlyX
MDTLQIQISELNQKVEQLYRLVERISCQVNTLTEENRQPSDAKIHSLSSISSILSQSSSSYEENDCSITHKDILVDDNSSKNNPVSGKEQELAPDIQIRRLTAQLTAAYNRIAALEEQLLARRIQS